MNSFVGLSTCCGQKYDTLLILMGIRMSLFWCIRVGKVTNKASSTRTVFTLRLIPPRGQGRRCHSWVLRRYARSQQFLSNLPLYEELFLFEELFCGAEDNNPVVCWTFASRVQRVSYTPRRTARLLVHTRYSQMASGPCDLCARKQRRAAAFCRQMEFKSAAIAPAWRCISVGRFVCFFLVSLGWRWQTAEAGDD